MPDYPRNLPRILITWVIAVGLVLRSLIAPGFMLDASDGLAIIFCEGPAGIYSADSHTGHQDHAGHGEQHDEQGHFTPSCSHWSTSGLLVFNTFFEAIALPAPALLDLQYQPPFIQQYSSSLRPNRGPPFPG